MNKIAMPCVIMCGGASSRMRQEIGVDKTTLPFGGKESLTEFQVAKFIDSFDFIYLSAKEPKFGSSFNYIFDMSIVEDVNTSNLYAPTLSLYSALIKLQKSILFIPADMPLITIKTVTSLVELSDSKCDAAVLRVDGKVYPTCGVYKPNVISKLEEMIKENRHKLQLFLGEIDTIYMDLDSNDEFININNYSEYERICKK